jgi:Domain of unknown function (DUF1840)
MLFEFKSQATGSVVMTDPVGRKVLAVIGKDAVAQGIITVAQMPEAIARLKAAAASDKALTAEARRAGGARQEEPADDDTRGGADTVGLSQRVVPLIDMLEAAHRAGKDITWGT